MMDLHELPARVGAEELDDLLVRPQRQVGVRKVDEEVEVELPGGITSVRWLGQGPVFLRGPVVTVYRGEVDPDAL